MSRQPHLREPAFAGLAAFLVFSACSPAWAQNKKLEPAPGCYLAGGTEAFESGDLDLAEKDFRAALRALPGLLEARENLAITWARKGELQAAVAEFTGILGDRPGWAEAHYNLGLVLVEEKDRPGAMQHFRKALEANPAYPEAHNSL